MNGLTRSGVLVCLGVLSACQSGYQSTKKSSGVQVPRVTHASNAQSNRITVQSGETLFGISFRAGLNYRDVALWNGIDEPYTIKAGQVIRLSPPASFADNASLNRAAPSLPNAKPSLSKNSEGALATSLAAPNPMPASRSVVAWQWPTDGRVADGFIADDKSNQGINITGNAGQKVAAAADGVVVYSGAGLIGYGELIIVKHSNEWISAYAHNAKRLVAEGMHVSAGQQIATMGQTGAVRDMLHFEIRHNGKPVDPILYLPKQ